MEYIVSFLGGLIEKIWRSREGSWNVVYLGAPWWTNMKGYYYLGCDRRWCIHGKWLWKQSCHGDKDVSYLWLLFILLMSTLPWLFLARGVGTFPSGSPRLLHLRRIVSIALVHSFIARISASLDFRLVQSCRMYFQETEGAWRMIMHPLKDQNLKRSIFVPEVTADSTWEPQHVYE